MPLAIILTLAMLPMFVFSLWLTWQCTGLCDEWGTDWQTATTPPPTLSRWRRWIDPYVG